MRKGSTDGMKGIEIGPVGKVCKVVTRAVMLCSIVVEHKTSTV